MTMLCVIPARFHSRRLPEKPLAMIGDLPLVMHVYNRAVAAEVFDQVIVATDDRRIVDAVTRHGGRAVLTSADHPSGTDRVFEVMQSGEWTHVVNLQGDEPRMPPELLRTFTNQLGRLQSNYLLTCVANATIEEKNDPNVVKVVCSAAGEALYFSRAPIPCDRDGRDQGGLKHIGLYGFTRPGLQQFCQTSAGKLETREKLEQLRALEAGMRIRCLHCSYNGEGIDTAEQLARFRHEYRTSHGTPV